VRGDVGRRAAFAVAGSAAASIANCNPNNAAMTSMSLAFVAFVVSFGFF